MLSNVKKRFHNQTYFGFRVNSSGFDLEMIAKDLSRHLNLYDLNISGKMAEAMNKYNNRQKNRTKKILLGTDECSKEYKNINQFCKLTGIDINLENYGIPSEHVDIFLSNMIGYLPCGLLITILSFVTITFYIIQIILSFFFFKASDHTSPTILEFILFYFGDAILLASAIFYFISYDGISSTLTTLITFDELVNQVTSPLSKSFQNIINFGIPDAVNPVISNMMNIFNTTQKFFNETATSFLSPTIDIFQKLVSENESDPGIFHIYNFYINNVSKEFYISSKKYSKLENISVYFHIYNFTPFQRKIQNLFDKELELSEKINEMNSLFELLNSILYKSQKYISNLINQKVYKTNKTFGEIINDFENNKIYHYLAKMNSNNVQNSKYSGLIRIIFVIFGFFLFFSSCFYAIVFNMHNKFSICIASTISIYPIIATILMFFISFIFTEFGSAEVSISDQFEPAIDHFISSIVDIAFPFRTIEIPIINITQITNNFYEGEMNLSNIVFPNPMNNIERFVNMKNIMGLADSLQLSSIVDFNKYGNEISDFIIKLGENYSLPEAVVALNENVEKFFRLVSNFPKTIDGFFNWGIQITLITKQLRHEINKMDSTALQELEPYLSQIDTYVNLMNSQYQIVLYDIYEKLANALDKIDDKLINFIHSVMVDLGSSVKLLLNKVYPVLNMIKNEPFIAFYTKIRNMVFYDLASIAAYMSISSILMMTGFVFIVVLMWLRRKGMSPEDNLQIRRNASSKLDTTESDINIFFI